MRNCDKCVKNDVCKLLHGNTLERFDRINRVDFVEALRELKDELGENCRSYLEMNESNTQLPEKSEYTQNPTI